jgi:hypothetical protein
MTDWVRGDMLGLEIPAHPQALVAGGEAFLTRAFRASGRLPDDQRVARIQSAEVLAGGSTGSKMCLGVEYDPPSLALHRDLFVKFSRDFADPGRDRARVQMEREVRFALLSRDPGFPVRVPTCYCADYQLASGTGILITERIPYGTGAIEPHYPKCLDYRLPDELPYYRALVAALARLAAYRPAGRDASSLERNFPFDPGQLTVSGNVQVSPEQLGDRIRRYAVFAADFPHLLPDPVRSPSFLGRLLEEAPRFLALAPRIREILAGRPEMIALCHWNANIDNAWFWRDENGARQCGLLDWGNVSRMNLAMGLWGCLSGAELRLWDKHLDELLALFAAEYRRGGGAQLEPDELDRHMALYAISMGIQWLLDVPAYLRRRLPDMAGAADRHDPALAGDETARTRLQMLCVFLNLWQQRDFDRLLPEYATRG